MINLTDFETPAARRRREKKERIIKDYISCATYIRLGKVTPHKVFTILAMQNSMSRQGVQELLIREGIYQGHLCPVNIPDKYKVLPKQQTLPFFLEGTGQPALSV